MIFASPIFLFWFLPLVLLINALLPRGARNAWLLLTSYAFYGWWRFDFAVLMIISSLVDFFAAQYIDKETTSHARRRLALIGSLCANLGLLAYFKYANFGVDTLNALLEAAGHEPVRWTRVLLPVGISFYTFQTLSYTIDVYRGEVKATKDILAFSTFVALFPQLVAGPIVRYVDIAEQLRERSVRFDSFARGAFLFIIGFEKKILLADIVAPIVDQVFSYADPSTSEAWLGAIAYTLQLYFDFSGYSDMAIGLGLLLGFDFPANFDSPYKSESITEFWRRWHITLSTWLRDYLYVPLGGNRRGERRTYVNLALTMLLGGLWHGANWTFIVWGAWHGGLLAFERAIGRRPLYSALPKPIRIGLTLLLVMLGWIVFRADSIESAFTMWSALFGATDRDGMRFHADDLQLTVLGIGITLALFAPTAQRLAARPNFFWLVLSLLFPFAIMQLLFAHYSPFLYFQF